MKNNVMPGPKLSMSAQNCYFPLVLMDSFRSVPFCSCVVCAPDFLLSGRQWEITADGNGKRSNMARQND